MRRLSWFAASALAGLGLVFGAATVAACSGGDGSTFPNDHDDGGDGGHADVVVVPPIIGDEGGPGHAEGGVACPPGLTCDVECDGGKTTKIRGKVYDPAGKNPLYNVAVYVPATALSPLPKGVPTGGDACSCSALFKSGAVANTTTDVDGSFELTNVPVGKDVPLVLQVGKWRRLVHVPVTACSDNAQPDKSLKLPGTVAAGDTDDNIPDIAVSTGGADTLECLMRRIGIPASEYVAGAGAGGHVHVYSGGTNAGGAGKPERHPMPGAPASDTDLWASQAQLMPYDILLLSCEGNETYDAKPAALEQYLNAGGRAFASHFHYAWFSGPLKTQQSYSAPNDWGKNLATWSVDDNTDDGPIGGVVDTTLNGQSGKFAKGQALAKWLGLVGALGQNNVPADELSIYSPRYNASVGASNTPSQPWLTADSNARVPASTMYFSFDTPVDAPAPPDGGAPSYCGRAVFSDLHVAGDPITNDTGNAKSGGSPPPEGCGDGDLSPQEKALEFMLFDLSSCVIPDTVAPPDAGWGVR